MYPNSTHLQQPAAVRLVPFPLPPPLGPLYTVPHPLHPTPPPTPRSCLSPGDLAFNIALGATLVALPLSIGAAARSAFVKYKFTDKRVSVKTDAPWESE